MRTLFFAALRTVRLRAGVGVEFPVSGSISARMEYLIGDSSDFRLAANANYEPDAFSPHDAAVRVGLRPAA